MHLKRVLTLKISYMIIHRKTKQISNISSIIQTTYYCITHSIPSRNIYLTRNQKNSIPSHANTDSSYPFSLLDTHKRTITKKTTVRTAMHFPRMLAAWNTPWVTDKPIWLRSCALSETYSVYIFVVLTYSHTVICLKNNYSVAKWVWASKSVFFYLALFSHHYTLHHCNSWKLE